MAGHVSHQDRDRSRGRSDEPSQRPKFAFHGELPENLCRPAGPEQWDNVQQSSNFREAEEQPLCRATVDRSLVLRDKVLNVLVNRLDFGLRASPAVRANTIV